MWPDSFRIRRDSSIANLPKKIGSLPCIKDLEEVDDSFGASLKELMDIEARFNREERVSFMVFYGTRQGIYSLARSDPLSIRSAMLIVFHPSKQA